MLDQWRRQWANIKPTSVQWLMSAGSAMIDQALHNVVSFRLRLSDLGNILNIGVYNFHSYFTFFQNYFQYIYLTPTHPWYSGNDIPDFESNSFQCGERLYTAESDIKAHNIGFQMNQKDIYYDFKLQKNLV